MIIALDSFETQIDSMILKRGLSYFKNNKVTDFFENAPGEFEAIINGSESYNVNLKISNSNLVSNSCTCPYTFGPVCKHVAAALFYYLQEDLGIKPKAVKTSNAPKLPKIKKDAFDEILNKLSPEDLADFIEKMASSNPEFKASFMNYFASINEEQSLRTYSDSLRPLLNSVRGPHGYVDRSKVKPAVQAVVQMLENSKTAFARADYMTVFYINAALIEEFNRFANRTDDSGGYLHPYIYNAVDNMKELVNVKLQDSMRKAMFKHFTDKFKKKTYKGWDWHEEQLRFASKLVTNDKEFELLRSLMQSAEFSSWMKEFYLDKYMELEFDLIHFYKGESDALDYAGEFSNYPSMRRKLIQDAIREADYDTAKMLVHNGIDLCADNLPGLRMEWRDYLFEIAKLENDPAVLKIALANFYTSSEEKALEYYEQIKRIVPPEQWASQFKVIAKFLNKNKNRIHLTIYRKICVKENFADLLMESLEKDEIRIQIPSEFESMLVPTYSDRLASLYANSVKQFLESHVGRDYYKYAAQMIRQIIKIGASDQAQELVKELKEKYKQRPGLLVELAYI